jgi:hypothetical protein
MIRSERRNIYIVSSGSAVSRVLGTIGFPDSSKTGEMLDDHKIVAMKMKSELLAKCLPIQCLIIDSCELSSKSLVENCHPTSVQSPVRK